MRETTDGQPPAPGLENAPAPQPINPATGQHGAYWTGFLFIVFGEQEGHPLVVQNFSVTDLLRAAGAVAALQADIVDEERSHECPDCGG